MDASKRDLNLGFVLPDWLGQIGNGRYKNSTKMGMESNFVGICQSDGFA